LQAPLVAGLCMHKVLPLREMHVCSGERMVSRV
jgi:hypothetical protein